MSYEKAGFDPTSRQEDPESPFGVWHNNINDIGVHVVHPQEIYRRLEAGQRITLVDYEDPTGKSNMKHVRATAAGGENFSNQPATLYSATINLRKERDWQEGFLDKIDTWDYTRLETSAFYWANTRLLSRPGTQLIIQATIFSPRIELNNQITNSGSNSSLLVTRLSAPARKDAPQGEQLAHVFDSLTAMMCVANSLGKDTVRSPGGNLIITPDGPLYKNPDTGEYVHRLGREQITVTKKLEPKQSRHRFDQLFGVEHIKGELQPLILFHARPDLAAKWRVGRPGNVLLFGPAGTGKTVLVHALANEIGAELHEISPADTYGKWLGDSEKAIKAIFDKVRNAKKPTILLLDEMEGIVNVTEDNASSSRTTNAVAGIFKTESGRISNENPNVIIAATTNNPDRLDPALIRAGRFDVRIAVGLPDASARCQIFGNLILDYHSLDVGALEPESIEAKAASFNPYSPDLLHSESLSKLAELTNHDFSAADIIEVLRRAALIKATEEERSGKEPSPIDLAFLTDVIHSMRQNRV